MYDIIIRGGTVIDGTGAPGYRADIAVRDGLIAEIGELSGCCADRVLDAEGLSVAPGFIDSHAHSDTSFLKDSSCASKLYQGITTEVTGQCGSSPFPALPEMLDGEDEWHCASFAGFVDKFEREGHSMAVNQAMLVGHGSLRAGVIGCEDRPVDASELENMKRLLRSELESGAWGMSLGLEYSPGFFAGADELAALGGVVKEFGGVVTCHMRSEGLAIAEAIDELADIGRASGVHVHISHLKLDNYRMHGRTELVRSVIDKAKADGVNITADMYPYTASCTSLTIRCPKWSQDGGSAAVVDFLNGPRRQEVVEGIRSHYFNAERAETCLFNDDGGLWPEIVGKTLRYVAEEYLHTTDYAEAAAEVLVRTKGRAGCIFFVMNEQDMLEFLSWDVGIGSDGWALSGDAALVDGSPHPRSYGAVAEFLRLNRLHKLCTLEEAVRRVTSKPADMIGMKDRGRLMKGMAADITVFDPGVIEPTSTYLAPVSLARGVRHVLVNGIPAMEDGVQTEMRPGRFLRKRY